MRKDLTSKIHPDFHYTSDQVTFVGELEEMFSDEMIALSVDDNNKVHVGTLAFSKHSSINNIFAINDQPNYPNHDFPYANAKLFPAGYLKLKLKKGSLRVFHCQRGIRRLTQRENIVPHLHDLTISPLGITKGEKYL